MTTITVRLIFWGLIGFVPDLDGARSLTALLVDPARTQVQQTACPLPTHYSVVYLLDGECEGDCRKVPLGKDFDADLMGFNQKVDKKVGEEVTKEPLELAWMLDQEELEISDEDDDTLKLQKSWLRFLFRQAPRSVKQASYFSWAQSMKRLSGGEGKVKDDCLGKSEKCPLQARFRVDGGAASACHLFHTPDELPGSKRNVQIFKYTTANNRHPKRVAADAILVEFKARGRVALTSQGLPKRDRDKATAWLTPTDSRGIITLVVADLPAGPSLAEPHSHERSCLQPHSDALYELLINPPSSPPVRALGPTRLLNPGTCEPEAKVLAELLSRASGEIPHSTTSCDGATYP